jgi:hypothetical protein
MFVVYTDVRRRCWGIFEPEKSSYRAVKRNSYTTCKSVVLSVSWVKITPKKYTDVRRRPWSMFKISTGFLGEGASITWVIFENRTEFLGELSDFDVYVHGRDLGPPRQQQQVQVQVRSIKISETDVQG